MSKFHVPTIDIVSVAEDGYGLCAKAHIQFHGASTHIRWGVDEFTYTNLDACLKQHVSRDLVLDSRVPSDASRVGWLRITSDRQDFGGERDGTEQRFPVQGFFLDNLYEATFLCSAVFASNLIWLYEMTAIEDLNGIRWGIFPDDTATESIDGNTRVESTIEDKGRQPHAVEPFEDERLEREPFADETYTYQNTTQRNSSGLRPGKKGRGRTGMGSGKIGAYAASAVALLVLMTGSYAWMRQNIGKNKINEPMASRFVASNTVNASELSNAGNQSSFSNSLHSNLQPNNTAPQHAAGSAPTATSQHTISSSQNTSATKSYATLNQQHGPAQGVQVYHEATHASDAREVWEVPKGEVALTFDDGPTPMTSDFVKLLTKYGIHATFFFVGQQVKYWPDSVKLAAASGEVIGDHSMTHPDFTGLTEAQQEAQILDDRAELEQLTNHRVFLFRPPYGAYNDTTGDILASNGMFLALWNRDPQDWAAKTPEEVVQAVLDSNPSGGLYDLHEDKVTLAALPTIIEGLKARGLKFVTLGAPILSSNSASGGV